jgi:predicted PurR-regulated permease PerM
MNAEPKPAPRPLPAPPHPSPPHSAPPHSSPPHPTPPHPAPRPALPARASAVPGQTALRIQRWILFGALFVAILVALNLFASILLPFVAASGIAYVLDPPCARMARARIPRSLAALLLITGLILVGFLFVLLLYPLIVSQIGLLVGHVPDYVRGLSAFAARLISRLQQHLGPEYVDAKLSDLVSGQFGSIVSFLAGATSRVVGSGYALFNVLSLLVVTPVVAFYLLRDWPRVVAMVDGWLPRRFQGVIRAQAHEVDRILSAWVRGQAMCCMILAVFYALALSIVGLELGLVVGLTAGFLSFIPYVGSITGAVTAIALAFAQFDTWEGVLRVVVVFAVGQVLEGYVIYPRFLGDRVELPAVWVIFALFAGGAAFGFLGVMLAVPVAATVGVLARFWLRRYLKSPLYLEPPSA